MRKKVAWTDCSSWTHTVHSSARRLGSARTSPALKKAHLRSTQSRLPRTVGLDLSLFARLKHTRSKHTGNRRARARNPKAACIRISKRNLCDGEFNWRIMRYVSNASGEIKQQIITQKKPKAHMFSVQFGSRCYLRVRKKQPYALHPFSQKFPRRCL